MNLSRRSNLALYLRRFFGGVLLPGILLAACSATPAPPTLTPTFGAQPTVTGIPWRASTDPIRFTNADRLARLGSLIAHSATVNRIVFSHDAGSMLSQDGNGKVIAWDLATGQLRYRLSSTSAILNGYYTADDTQIVTVGFDNQIRIWSTVDGSQSGITSTDTSGVTTAASSPDGQVLAVGSNDGVISVWRGIPTSKPNFNVQGVSGRLIRALAVSADGRQFASIASDQTVRVWDAVSGASRATLTKFTGFPLQVTFSPDNKLFAVATEKELDVFSATDYSQRFTLAEPDLAAQRGMAFSPDGKFLAAGSTGSFVYAWNTNNGLLSAHLPGHNANFTTLAFSPDSSLLFTCGLSAQSGAYIWNTQQFVPENDSFARGSVSSPTDQIYLGTWSPDGKRLITGDVRGSLTVWGIPAK